MAGIGRGERPKIPRPLGAQGKENRAIADELVISEATVRTHVSNILGKLHLASRTQAALYALREGLASLDDVVRLKAEGGAGMEGVIIGQALYTGRISLPEALQAAGSKTEG